MQPMYSTAPANRAVNGFKYCYLTLIILFNINLLFAQLNGFKYCNLSTNDPQPKWVGEKWGSLKKKKQQRMRWRLRYKDEKYTKLMISNNEMRKKENTKKNKQINISNKKRNKKKLNYTISIISDIYTIQTPVKKKCFRINVSWQIVKTV